jgi:hypothetical protein
MKKFTDEQERDITLRWRFGESLTDIAYKEEVSIDVIRNVIERTVDAATKRMIARRRVA